MKDQGVAKHVVVGHLFESRHAALIEMTNSLSGKLRNHFILKIAEACLEKYPIRMSDYSSSRDEVGKGTPLKITIREDLYPRMFSRYKDLPHGIRSTVMMNLLNRHAELMAGAPEIVEDAVRVLDAASLDSSVKRTEMEVAGGSETTTIQAPPVPIDILPVEQPNPRPETSAAVPTAAAAIEEEDPLIGLESGL
ncbi:hypothetical protein QAO71_17215 (plasmid) [Halopseudomonas sp. SMJS2]|uniref:hypothetical protein n=1 Tax=Halopseudomonas sp. SMJS2 TaxID=3041098 RepID=UPI0024534F51|nr:hypothetical protein [Halopseudomonas sp. SMJS2]WGK63508.1 hypothetical protein QAO71_17215 [Halopseudomonas sp. SMJS2]